MANQDYSVRFKNAFIDLKNDIITEVTKDENKEYKLSDVLRDLEGRELSISFKETKSILSLGE